MKNRQATQFVPSLGSPSANFADFREDEKDKALSRLDQAVERFNARLGEIEKKCSGPARDSGSLVSALSRAIADMASACEEFEKTWGADRLLIRQLQKNVREKTDRFFLQSRLMRHARTWPRGYPGDYVILEDIYDGCRQSQGLGCCLDRYFLSTILARSVRERKETMRSLLMAELAARKSPKILNVACGSCREIAELAPEVAASGARMICVDADPEAIRFCEERLSRAGIGTERVQVRRYNALKMVSHERNVQEFGMQDIVYSIGLLDYLKDDILVALMATLYRLVNPGGKLVVSFKDSRRYKTQEYHWLVDWNSFFQRTEEEQWSLVDKAGIPRNSVDTRRDATGVVVFFIMNR